ncbi:MAG: hypothetical protein ACXVAG_17060, partial [Vulcanimicrobiaceae bacterium]
MSKDKIALVYTLKKAPVITGLFSMGFVPRFGLRTASDSGISHELEFTVKGQRGDSAGSAGKGCYAAA